MTTLTELRADFTNTVNRYGQPVCLKFYNQSGAVASYDDDKVLTQSGTTIWTSGLMQSLNSRFGSADAQLVQEGRIKFDDSKVYIPGDVYTTGGVPLKIGIGSPTPTWYVCLPEGVNVSPLIDGGAVYKKLYVRYLNSGSLSGE